jgi:hypothetical protein
VLSLTIMAAMVMMVIVLASFLQVESRLAQANAGFLRARFNALASARIAVAQLQVMAGPDQRVTMRADMFSPDVALAAAHLRPDRARSPTPTSRRRSRTSVATGRASGPPEASTPPSRATGTWPTRMTRASSSAG